MKFVIKQVFYIQTSLKNLDAVTILMFFNCIDFAFRNP